MVSKFSRKNISIHMFLSRPAFLRNILRNWWLEIWKTWKLQSMCFSFELLHLTCWANSKDTVWCGFFLSTLCVHIKLQVWVWVFKNCRKVTIWCSSSKRQKKKKKEIDNKKIEKKYYPYIYNKIWLACHD